MIVNNVERWGVVAARTLDAQEVDNQDLNN